jgi:aminocarboxymuconate-semialdehyde decarboxylase
MIPLDIHTHLAPVGDAMASQDGVEWDATREHLVIDGHKLGIKDLFHPERLVARMDRQGIARSLVSIPPPLYRQGLSSDGALTWAQAMNKELLAIASARPDRLGALFYIPLEHPSLFETLMLDCEAGPYEGISLAAGGHPAILFSDPRYDVLWAWLESRRAFVFLHPGTCSDPRLSTFYLENLIGNPVETGVAAAHLIMAGVPSRYPNIRFALAHAGGIFTALVGRMERGFETSRPGVNCDVERPLQAARRFYVDDIAHHSGTLQLARQIVGNDHVLYGSDWPFPMGHADPHG